MSKQTTLLTAHKGVDLHAATAVRVMRERLDGGNALVRLFRAEFATFWDAPVRSDDSTGGPHGDHPGDRPDVAVLLESGRYFNPNKHHHGHFVTAEHTPVWTDADSRGAKLPAAWPGQAAGTDLPNRENLYERLLGGAPARDEVAVDVCAWPLGQTGPLLTGVVWRLILRPEGRDPRRFAERLAVTRSRRVGLLVNPHMESWRLAVRPPRG